MIKRIARITLAVVMVATVGLWHPTFNPSVAHAISACPTSPLTGAPYDSNYADGSAINAGVKFTVKGAPYVTGVNFYKGTDNTGTHIAHLYDITASSDLASEAYTSETSTGWQSVSFDAPVAVDPTHNYMVWVSMPNGHYAVDGTPGGSNSFYNQGFGGSTDAVRIAQGNSGVYSYSANHATVPSTFGTDNYWVSPVVADTVDPIAATTVTADDDAAGTDLSWTGGISDENAAYSSGYNTVKTEFLRTEGMTTTVIGSQLGNVPYWTSPVGTQQDTTAKPGTNYTYGVRFYDACGNVSTTTTDSVSTASQSLTSIFSNISAPSSVDTSTDPTVVGTHWESSSSGSVWGARIYRASATVPTSSMRAMLWDNDGTLLASAWVPDGTQQTGWIDVRFPTPVSVSANHDYVIGYYSPNGQETYTTSQLTSAVANGTLTARADTSMTPNGVYSQGGGTNSATFPTNRAPNSTWYGVDVNFY